MATKQFSVATNVQGKLATFQTKWNLNRPVDDANGPLFQTLDIAIDGLTVSNNHSEHNANLAVRDEDSGKVVQMPEEKPCTHFLRDQLQKFGQSGSTFLKIVFAQREGYCIRSDFLERRLDGCQSAVKVQSFLEPRQKIECPSPKFSLEAHELGSLMATAVGAIVAKDQATMKMLEHDLDNRLSFPWISPDPIPHKRIAWVKGRLDLEFSQRIWEAAKALGISVVIIDNPGHWLQQDDPSWNHLREGFIPTSIKVDEGFVDRLVSAVRNYPEPIDSILTVSNERMVPVAQANQILGLPTTPPEAYAIAADKFKTREMERDTAGAFRVFSVQELKDRLSSKKNAPLEYPMVAKPCMGWGSECVSKVYTEGDLVRAVERASERHRTSPHQRTDVVIEPYIDGPEVDANVVMLNGEIVFFEVGDDFPSAGDSAKSWEANFQETSMVFPSGLPQSEIALIRESLHQSLLRQGFTHGVFHCEGRVNKSSMKFVTKDGKTELYPDEGNVGKYPSFFLHEINARPPGYLETVASHLTYGVDYYALQLLQGVGHMDLFRALSHPFKNGPQWWLVLLLLPEDKAGIMKTEDAAKELLDRSPTLKAAVPDCKTVQKKGSRLLGPDGSELNYVAYFSVVSRESRAKALELEQKIREEFSYEVE